MKLLLAADQSLFVEGLQNLLEAKGHRVVGAARDGREALDLARAFRPDVILMDIRMTPCDGLTAIRSITTEMPEIKIVVLTVSADDDDLFEALKCGASAYLLKTLDSRHLFECLAGLSLGEATLSLQMLTRLLGEFSRAADQDAPQTAGGQAGGWLTSRQRQILERAAAGLSCKEIGAALNINEHIVKYHLGEVLTRLHRKNREPARAPAMRTGVSNNAVAASPQSKR